MMPPRRARSRSRGRGASHSALRSSPQAQSTPARSTDREAPDVDDAEDVDVLPEQSDPEAIEKGEMPEDLPTSRENLPR